MFLCFCVFFLVFFGFFLVFLCFVFFVNFFVFFLSCFFGFYFLCVFVNPNPKPNICTPYLLQVPEPPAVQSKATMGVSLVAEALP